MAVPLPGRAEDGMSAAVKARKEGAHDALEQDYRK